MKQLVALAAFGAAALISVEARSATQMFSLAAVDPAAGLGSGPFGTVSVTENAGSLTFTETLNAGYRIHAGNSNHNAFTFSLVGSPSLTFSNVSSGFAAVGSVSAPPFGSFVNALDCTSCGPGYNGGFAGPLTFTVSAASALSLSSLAFNTYKGQHVYFTTDLVNGDGSTGNVGAVAQTLAVPDAATWAMFIGGFGLIGGTMRRRRLTPNRA